MNSLPLSLVGPMVRTGPGMENFTSESSGMAETLKVASPDLAESSLLRRTISFGVIRKVLVQ